MKPTVVALIFVLMASACLCFGGNKGIVGQENLGVSTTISFGGNRGTPGQENLEVSTTLSSGGISDRLADLAAAVSSGQSYKCTYTSEGIRVDSWVKGDRYSSELKTEDGTVVHSISDGTWVYTWAEGQPDGMKMRISDFETRETGTGEFDYASMADALENAMNVDCRPAVLQDGVFTPPSNVKFQDVGELMRQMQAQMNASGNAGVPDTCSYCSMITDAEARRECMKNC